MKFYKTAILVFAIFFTGSIANANSSQIVTDTEIQLATDTVIQHFKQFESSNASLVQASLDSKNEPCRLAEFMWRSSISQHFTSGYCRSNDCAVIGRSSTYCD